jgi:hypothetical protein
VLGWREGPVGYWALPAGWNSHVTEVTINRAGTPVITWGCDAPRARNSRSRQPAAITPAQMYLHRWPVSSRARPRDRSPIGLRDISIYVGSQLARHAGRDSYAGRFAARILIPGLRTCADLRIEGGLSGAV